MKTAHRATWIKINDAFEPIAEPPPTTADIAKAVRKFEARTGGLPVQRMGRTGR